MKMRDKRWYVVAVLVACSACVVWAAPEKREKDAVKTGLNQGRPRVVKYGWPKQSIDVAELSTLSVTDERVALIVEHGVEMTPDAHGILLSRKVVLPNFKQGIYYRPYSGGNGGNRIMGVPFSSIADLAGYKTNKSHLNLAYGQYMLLEIDSDTYLALMPMVSQQAASHFHIIGNDLVLQSGNFGTAVVQGDLPLMAWAYGTSPYEAANLAWKQAMESNYLAGDWRSNKVYPEMYEYLGWCSWEHYKFNINETKMTRAVHTLEQCGAPIRWAIIDDGYLTHENTRIISFTPDVKKFPNGWKPLTSMKNPEKIKWMGIWRNFLGYRRGISPDHQMDHLKDDLISNRGNLCMVPNGTQEGANAFFETMTLDAKNSGFDFTKVDFQAEAFLIYQGLDNPVSAMRANNEALEVSCKEHQLPLLNCIAQTHVNSYNFRYSSLLRVGRDYTKNNTRNNKFITYQSFANNLWAGQTVWGDFDMFHSHAADAEVMALARAISGGPVYISDEPGKIDPAVLKKFCLKDGKLLRANAPATLLPDSLFNHPHKGDKPLRVVAPLANNVAAIGFFNLTDKGAASGHVSAKDYPFAGELLQPYTGPWAQPKEGLLLYDPATMSAKRLTGTENFTIPNYQGKLLQLHPVSDGWVVIGRTDKYLPAAAVSELTASGDTLTFTLLESGPFAVWSQHGAPKMDGVIFEDTGNGLFVAELKVGGKEKVYELTR